ncbi:VanZ family protein [Lactiplantibacillus plantarum]|uniref:VanZ family protein n=1 Tax=Lactiplantibacillus plantarum TaxID=1590 RepID=UPI003FA44CB8
MISNCPDFKQVLTTIGIEMTQLIMAFFYLGSRTFDINDLILNLLGYLLGFCIYKVIKPIFNIESDMFRVF